MKTCPVCRSIAFDDAAICYGCLYDFAKEEEGAEAAPTHILSERLVQPDKHNQLGGKETPEACESIGKHAFGQDEADGRGRGVSFVITLTPEGEVGVPTSWRCTVDAVER